MTTPKRTKSDVPADTPDDYKCDCSDYRQPDIHRAECSLWDCWEFEEGWVKWDHEQGKLVEIYSGDDSWMEEFVPVTKIDGEPNGYVPLTTKTQTAFAPMKKCRHFQQDVVLPDGTVVYASSEHTRWKNDPIPDLGIYLDGLWTPDTLAFYVGCPDYDTPLPRVDQVLHVAEEGLRLARDGQRVEVGCIGGHGRTGMMLAIMAVLTMENPDGDEAVHYVRDHYCHHAVESETQIWYVRGIAAERKGEPWPPKPKPKPKTFTYTKSSPSSPQSAVTTPVVQAETPAPKSTATQWTDYLMGAFGAKPKDASGAAPK